MNAHDYTRLVRFEPVRKWRNPIASVISCLYCGASRESGHAIQSPCPLR
jgi:hypothetical protein